MHLLTAIQPLIHHYGLFGVFFIVFIEKIGIPFPAETTLILSGIEWKSGVFSFFPLFLAGFFGDITGSAAAYFIGRFLGRPFLLRFQKIFRMNDAVLDRAQARLLKAKIPVLVISKFIAGIRIIVPYLAGINKLPFSQFFLWNSIAAFFWVLLFITFGQTLALLINHTYQFIKETPWLWVPTLVLVAGGGTYGTLVWRKKKKNKKKETMRSEQNKSPH